MEFFLEKRTAFGRLRTWRSVRTELTREEEAVLRRKRAVFVFSTGRGSCLARARFERALLGLLRLVNFLSAQGKAALWTRNKASHLLQHFDGVTDIPKALPKHSANCEASREYQRKANISRVEIRNTFVHVECLGLGLCVLK